MEQGQGLQVWTTQLELHVSVTGHSWHHLNEWDTEIIVYKPPTTKAISGYLKSKRVFY